MTWAPSRKTAYPITATLSVLADHESVMFVVVMFDVARPVGSEGGVVSVEMTTGAVCAVVAVEEPAMFEAVTLARIVCPWSARTSTCELPVAPAIVVQFAPAASQSCQA